MVVVNGHSGAYSVAATTADAPLFQHAHDGVALDSNILLSHVCAHAFSAYTTLQHTRARTRTHKHTHHDVAFLYMPRLSRSKNQHRYVRHCNCTGIKCHEQPSALGNHHAHAMIIACCYIVRCSQHVPSICSRTWIPSAA